MGGRGKVGRGVSSRVMYLIWYVCIRNFLEQEPMRMNFLKFHTLKLILTTIHSLEGFFKSPVFQINYDITLSSIGLGPQ